MADVEMKPIDDKEEKKEEKTAAEEKKPVPLTPVAEIKGNVAFIERAVSTLEPRFTHRVLRSLAHLRKKLDDKVLRDAVQAIYTTGAFAHLALYTQHVVPPAAADTANDRLANKAVLAVVASGRTDGAIYGY